MSDPVESLARRLLEKNNLQPPTNLEVLVQGQSDLCYKPIPFDGIDGCIYNLKHPTKKTKIIINSRISKNRQRFTLAHEIGHLYIPWHYGNIIDQIAALDDSIEMMEKYQHYLNIEREANRFASELLMPTPWVKTVLSYEEDLSKVHDEITNTAQVSREAAAFKITACAEKPIIFAELDNSFNIIQISNSHLLGLRTPDLGTPAHTVIDTYKTARCYFNKTTRRHYMWWSLGSTETITPPSDEDWRSLLKTILKDSQLPPEDTKHIQHSLNGVFGSKKGELSRNNTLNYDRLYTDSQTRLINDKKYQRITEHPLFNQLVANKCQDML